MSVVSTVCSFAENTLALSNKEYEIMLVKNEIFTIGLAARNAIGDNEKLNRLHKIAVALEQELHGLQMEYEALKHRVESDQKMKKQAIKRSFGSMLA